MSQFGNRLPALRYHLASLSRFPFIKILASLSQTTPTATTTRTTHSGNSQMDSESNSSMEVVDVDKHEKQPQQQTTAGKMSPTHDSGDSDTDESWHWRCQPMESVQRGLQPYELDHLGPVQFGGQHKVLYRLPIREAANEPPRPQRSPHRWDAEHVRLPCAVESKYPVEAEDGTSDIESRWGMIERALLRPISSSKQLQAAILSYNTTYKNLWNFHALHELFEEELDESESRCFFEDLLPRIVRLALRLPELIQAPIPLLKQHSNCSLSLSQQQISCLLANAFLCTYPRRNTLKRKSEYSNFPDINFNRLYQCSGASVLEKLKCIFHYFRRVCPTERDASNVPTGCVTFVRLCDKPDEQINWSQSAAPLASIPIHINASGTIEDQGMGLLQVDFANRFLGGGVLGHGCVQEEIRFVICPELLISKLFTECLLPTEALLMVGCERFSNYTGYASSFVWAGNHEDHTPQDSSRRRRTAIVAIDALSFRNSTNTQQYREELIVREMNKASIGFKHGLGTPAPGVATGNWGCGAFGGDPHLKALIQIMVCAHHGRPLAYFTFGNCQLRDDLHVLWQLFRAHGTTVRQLWTVVCRFKKMGKKRSFYAYVLEKLRKLHNVSAGIAPRPMEVAKTTTKAATTTTGAAVAAATGAGAAQKSPDIFGDSSNGSMLSDDGDVDDLEQEQTNAMMLAATLESSSGGGSSSSSNSNATGGGGGVGAGAGAGAGAAAATQETAASNSPAHAAAAGGRQLTLLEMLDRHYEQGQPNGSKRQASTQLEICGKARKDCKEGDASSGTGNGGSNNSRH